MRDRFILDPRIRVLFDDLGVPFGALLHAAGLPRTLLANGPTTIPTAEYFAFWTAVEDFVDPATIPVRVAEALTVEVFNPPIFAATCSPDLNAAVHRLSGFKPLIGAMRQEVVQTETDTLIRFDWTLSGPPPLTLAWTELLFWVGFARLTLRRPISPIELTGPRLEDPSVIADYAGVTPTISGVHGVRFDASDAALPLLTADEGMWEYFAPPLRTQLENLERSATTADRVAVALRRLLPSGDGSMQSVGAELTVSTRTLQRRLKEEATSFQAVLAETRRGLAMHYLADSDLPVAQISFLLGYDEPSSFQRAFQEWTGTSPTRVRAEVA